MTPPAGGRSGYPAAMALRDRLRSLLRTPRAPAPLRQAAPPAAPAPVRVPAPVADPGAALLIDLDEVGWAGLADVKAPYVVVSAREPWRAAAAAERLQALGQAADWVEPPAGAEVA